jgi:hypothetical protein
MRLSVIALFSALVVVLPTAAVAISGLAYAPYTTKSSYCKTPAEVEADARHMFKYAKVGGRRFVNCCSFLLPCSPEDAALNKSLH